MLEQSKEKEAARWEAMVSQAQARLKGTPYQESRGTELEEWNTETEEEFNTGMGSREGTSVPDKEVPTVTMFK